MDNKNTYHFVIENESDEIKTAILFGQNNFLLTLNYGSNEGITIEPFYKHERYYELLHKSAINPFKPKMLRFAVYQSRKMPKKMFYFTKVENGNYVRDYKSYPINLITDKIDIYGDNEQVINDIKIDKYNEKDEFNISGHEYFEIEMQPKSKIQLIIF